MDIRSENSFASGIRPPSKIPSPGKLHEMSASATNSRLQSMPPPSKAARKTLVERAGEPAKPAVASSSSRPVNSYVPTTSLSGAPRTTSLSSSVSSRPPSSAYSRNISSTSNSSSVGAGSRPPSAQSFRSQSALGNSRIQKPSYSQTRPATSLDVHQEEPHTAQVLGKRKGRNLFSSSLDVCPESLQPTKLRGVGKSTPIRVTPREQRPYNVMSIRDFSMSTAMKGLSIDDKSLEPTPILDPEVPQTPSQIPKLVPHPPQSAKSSPSKSAKRKTPAARRFLNKETNVEVAWDTDQRLEEVEYMQRQLKEEIKGATAESNGLKEMTAVYKTRIAELENIRAQLTSSNSQLQADLDAAKTRLSSSSESMQDQKRHYEIEMDDLERQHRRDIEDVKRDANGEQQRITREHTDELESLQRSVENALAEEKAHHEREIQALSNERVSTQQRAEKELDSQRAAFAALGAELERCKAEVARERDINIDLRDQLAAASRREGDLESSVRRLEGHIHFLESDNKSQSQAFADLEERMQNALKKAAEANEKLIKEETLRRKLHNQVQELKGNIRVFCRVRPSLDSDLADTTARISYPDIESDSKEIEVMGPEEKSSLGHSTTRKHAFAFDRIFGPSSQNEDVFGEISQLVQSALDGYNVCIFCYGQTGSGKTFTMSAADGMIPRAVNQIYSTAQSLKEKGWKYSMEGSFIEVYNENLNDLLGRAEDLDKKKHEIRHDMQKCKTDITGIKTVVLDSPDRVEEILHRASKNRSVAATQANERSSRSHSVFILKLTGENSITGERSEGTLNLVDLAGSERLSHSGATGDRLKETQNINKSLSCLGDVIGALGQGKDGGHVPYRNSKLTYLLQFSLGGNSKTLMFVMISPLQLHLSETLTSLKFATKVHNTHIGTAKKQTKA